MKLFSPLYAAALAMGSLNVASATSCAVDCLACTADDISQNTPLVLTKADANVVCADGTFAYVTSLLVGAEDASTISISFSGIDTATPATNSPCDFRYDTPIGETTTYDIEVTVNCDAPINSTTLCPVKYLIEWDCTVAASNPNPAAETCTGECGDNDGCVVASVTTSDPNTETRDPVCDAGQRSYLTSLVVVPTDGSTIEVTFSDGLSNTALNPDTCPTKFGAVGDSDELTSDVSYTVTCKTPAGGDACAIRTNAVWGCKDKAVTPDSGSTKNSASGSGSTKGSASGSGSTKSSASGSGSPNATTPTSSPTPTPTTTTPTPAPTSGIASLGGATPLAVAVALVAVVGGVNFMMPA